MLDKIIFCISLAFLLSSIITYIVIRVCRIEKWYDTIDERKVHTGLIPRLGSIGIVVSAVIVIIVHLNIHDKFDTSSIPSICSLGVVFILGLIDDFFDLKAMVKFIIEAIAFIFVLKFEFSTLNIIFLIICFCWFIGITNSYNLIDGIDGLCGTLSFLAILTLGVYFAMNITPEIPLYHLLSIGCFIFCGAIAGFLVFNIRKAKIFMGDGGSLLLGFIIAYMALIPFKMGFSYEKIIFALNIVAIPMIDCIAAIWRRIREHRGIMAPDKWHLHHKFMTMGLSPTKTLIVIVLVQIVISSLSIISFLIPDKYSIVLLSFSFIVILTLFCVVHFKSRKYLIRNKEF